MTRTTSEIREALVHVGEALASIQRQYTEAPLNAPNHAAVLKTYGTIADAEDILLQAQALAEAIND